MSNTSQQSSEQKRQQAYQIMMEQIQKLVKEEGKTIQEATEIAEEKLSTWIELTKEETERVVKEVKRDLTSLADIIEESKEKIRKQWQNDAEFAKQKALETLASILEQANSGLSTLQKIIQENVQKGETKNDTDESTSYPLMHDDATIEEKEHKEHRQWHSEHALWLDEIKIWKKELKEVPTAVKRVKQGFEHFGEQIEAHAQAIRAHEVIENTHEAKLAEEHRDDPIHHAIHEEERVGHEQEAETHAKLKALHFEAMALLDKLQKILPQHD